MQNAIKGILIEKCSFQVFCQFNAKSGAIDQLRLGNQPVGQPWSICFKQA